MKYILALVFLLIMQVNAHSQRDTDVRYKKLLKDSPTRYTDQDLFEEFRLNVKHAHSLKKAGGILIFTGTASTGIGYFLYLDATQPAKNHAGVEHNAGQQQLGSILVGAGGGLLLNGLILSMIGDYRFKYFLNKIDHLELKPVVYNEGAGFSVCYRF